MSINLGIIELFSVCAVVPVCAMRDEGFILFFCVCVIMLYVILLAAFMNISLHHQKSLRTTEHRIMMMV